ncbi:ABC transporter ATP-binding protein [Paenibacillus montanisoli]|uniref:Multidrug ABC transporter permease/ATP-binding protein n=1 Tax=Paenibacillus montanisoli TaxID=2081970 RepID=A0A328U7Y2_9BACL|nr:ABC transporter transmembrane domain-containing protein [Paenibacillus montanisoli]RAP77511.1 multidrug ABC transporter permease/ATP-binding protein [Paenibacillus montanisoli]
MFDVLRKLSWFFKMQWKRYTVAIVLLTICGILEVIPPKLIGYAVDTIGQGAMTSQKLTELLLFWAGLTVVIYLITCVWWSLLFGSSFLLERTLRSRIMRHLLKMTPTFYERNRTGDLMARATNDIGAVSTTAGFGILTLIDSTLFMTTILFVMAGMISWKLTLAAMLPLPVLALVMQHFGKKIHERFTVQQDAFGNLNDQVLESVSGVRVIRAFVQEEADRKRFSDMTDEVFRKNIDVAKIDALFEPALKILVGISYLIGLCYGGLLVFRGEISLGEMVSFNMFLGMLIWPMFAIGELINIMQRGNASLDRINETLGIKPNVKDAESPVKVPVPESVETERLTFRYPSSSIDNLVDISFKLKRGQTLGIVGRTGSGKTTLLRQLLREYPMGQGSLTAGGVPITDIELDQIRSWIGYVPQQPILFSKTIRENIAYGTTGGTMDEVMLDKALELAAFRKDVTFLPDGLETLVGEKGVALSGGQKQRVSIARAVIANPEILMLDDALSAVDAKTETEILEGLRRERAGKTTLITTHRLSAVQHADWIIVLDEGRIAEEGTHEQLLLNNGWYKEQYDRQQLASLAEE